MIIWGTRANVVHLGQDGIKPCPVCEKERKFNYILQYRYFHLYWLFGMVTHKEYLLLCEICNRGSKLDTATIEQQFSKSLPIPFMQQFGLVILGGGIGALILLQIIGTTGLGILAIAGIGIAVTLLIRQQQ